jgi:hypothetical protein
MPLHHNDSTRSALCQSTAHRLVNAGDKLAAVNDPLAGRLFVSLRTFAHVLDVGLTHAWTLLSSLDPPPRRSGRRLLIPVAAIRTLADRLPTGVGAEPAAARHTREARALEKEAVQGTECFPALAGDTRETRRPRQDGGSR